MEFKNKVKQAIDKGLTQALSQEFEVAPSTVKRWASGIAIPHPLLQSQIVIFIDSNT